MTFPRTLVVQAAVVLPLAFLAACGKDSVDTIPQADVEQKAATQLAKEVGAAEEPNISCPDDLEAKAGATMDCELSVDGEDDVYAVHVEVDSIEDGTYHLTFKVADTPS